MSEGAEEEVGLVILVLLYVGGIRPSVVSDFN